MTSIATVRVLSPQQIDRPRDDAGGDLRLAETHFVGNQEAHGGRRVLVHPREHVIDRVALEVLQRMVPLLRSFGLAQSRVGDTVTSQHHGATEPLGGYKHPNPMVYAGLYPIDGDDYPTLRDALERLQLNDAALAYEPETSGRARLRLPVRLPRPAAHGDRPRAARARVQPRPDLDRAQRGLRGDDGGRHRSSRCTNPSEYPDGQDRRGPRAGRPGHDPVAVATTSARSWSSARPSAAARRAWTTSPRTGSRCATRCRWARSSSTSSTS